jgi:hypothetical protein
MILLVTSPQPSEARLGLWFSAQIIVYFVIHCLAYAMSLCAVDASQASGIMATPTNSWTTTMLSLTLLFLLARTVTVR